jgi:membrane protease YdiL (CAAX protease family)
MEPAPDRLSPTQAAIVGAGAFLLLVTLGYAIQVRVGGLPGVVLTELVVVLAPVLGALRLARVPLADGLGWRAPSPREALGALVAIAGGFYLVSAVVEPLQERLVPMPESVRAQLRDMLLPSTGPRPLAFDLLGLALVPALCEETLFRGALLRAFAGPRRATVAAALVGTSLAFGCFHFSLYKLVPTALLGLLLGAIALRAASLPAAILAHAAHNTLVVVLVRAGHEELPLPASPSALLLPAAAVAAIVGGLTLLTSKREKL